MSYYIEEATMNLLTAWQNASLTDYAHLVLAITILGWFISRYERKVGT